MQPHKEPSHVCSAAKRTCVLSEVLLGAASVTANAIYSEKGERPRSIHDPQGFTKKSNAHDDLYTGMVEVLKEMIMCV